MRTLLSLTVFISALPALHALDWPQFRGPNRDGISQEKSLLKQWLYKGKTEAVVRQVFGTPDQTQGGWMGYTSMNITNPQDTKYGTVWFGIADGKVAEGRFAK